MKQEDDAGPTKLESEVREMQLKEEDSDGDMDTIAVAEPARQGALNPPGFLASRTGTPVGSKRPSRSPKKQQGASESPVDKMEHEETVGGDVNLKLEPGKPPKLSRTTSHKIQKRPPPLFLDYDDKTAEAMSFFDVIRDCTYANKHLGTTEPALECDCAEEWDPIARRNHACGEDSDCINRATKMECSGDCGCGTRCQNQRFQRKQYANVAVIKTEKKGYGLRAETDLRPNDFIFEYIGEVIGEQAFRRRMVQYDEEGIKHFYFMSLTKGEFVDATKRGNLGRFCNHSCNPNCYVDKWVVDDKLRMGIFAERKIKAGEELVFNYNVDRYGAEPQPCYCGEPNCTGYIGGKTQTDRGTKLSNAIIEALGIDDADAWDTAVAKRPRKKKAGEDDEEYVSNVEPRGLDEEGVNKVMSSLMQCKEKWIAVKLLTRIQRADDEKVRNRVVRFHGYRILKTVLTTFSEDVNVCLQILDVLDKMPRLTRNKIQDSKIEDTVGPLTSNEDERVASLSKSLMDTWSKLEIGYRIPRVKRDPNAAVADRKQDRMDRRDQDRRRSRSRSRSKTPPKAQAPVAPRKDPSNRRPFPRFRPPVGALPPGWFEATAANGAVYYYNQSGTTTWQKPTVAAKNAPPPPPPKAVSDQQYLQDLIKTIVATKKESTRQPSETTTPVPVPKADRKEDKWRSLPEEKQRKLYESALQPHVMHVVSKFKHKLAKDDLKRWAKEFTKQVVVSDFKKGRVESADKISDKKAKEVKKHAHVFFEKAVKKKAAADARKAVKSAKGGQASSTPVASPPAMAGSPLLEKDEDGNLSDDGDMHGSAEAADATPGDLTDGPAALKRLRDENDFDGLIDEANAKKQRTESVEPPPPPPPPPPPAEEPFSDDEDTAMADAVVVGKPADLPTRDVVLLNGGSTSQPGEPVQTATPTSATTSPEDDPLKRGNFAGVNPDRLRQLGVLDGTSE